jgi:hypothetical protein
MPDPPNPMKENHMSNRSEWQLAFRGSRKKILKLEKYFAKVLDDKSRSTTTRTAMSVILNNKTMVAEKKVESQRALSFAHSFTTCDKTWNALIEELLGVARKTLKISASYARLGEAVDDHEFNCDDGLPIKCLRYLAEVEL